MFAATDKTVMTDEVLLPASVSSAFKIRATYMLARMIAFPHISTFVSNGERLGNKW